MKNVNGKNLFTSAEGVCKVMDCIKHSQFKDYIIYEVTLAQYAGWRTFFEGATYLVKMAKAYDEPIEEHWVDVGFASDGKLYAGRVDNVYA